MRTQLERDLIACSPSGSWIAFQAVPRDAPSTPWLGAEDAALVLEMILLTSRQPGAFSLAFVGRLDSFADGGWRKVRANHACLSVCSSGLTTLVIAECYLRGNATMGGDPATVPVYALEFLRFYLQTVAADSGIENRYRLVVGIAEEPRAAAPLRPPGRRIIECSTPADDAARVWGTLLQPLLGVPDGASTGARPLRVAR
jgi:hypothetical protein